MPSIDFEKFRSLVTLKQTADALRITAKRFFPPNLRCQCPICWHEDPTACRVDWQHNRWYCHRCKSGGGTVELASRHLECGQYQAVVRVCVLLGIDVPYRERVRTRRGKEAAAGEKFDDDADDEVS